MNDERIRPVLGNRGVSTAGSVHALTAASMRRVLNCHRYSPREKYSASSTGLRGAQPVLNLSNPFREKKVAGKQLAILIRKSLSGGFCACMGIEITIRYHFTKRFEAAGNVGQHLGSACEGVWPTALGCCKRWRSGQRIPLHLFVMVDWRRRSGYLDPCGNG